MSIPRFHLAVPVDDLDACRDFYGRVLGCAEGRSDTDWVDFNLYGHQLVIHRVDQPKAKAAHNPVDGHDVPVPHFGVLLSPEDWQELADRLRGHNITFVIEPYVRFEGEPGEQSTMFFIDPAGNALEFKSFADDAQVFAT